VRGGWRYLYRAIDRAGALVDVMLSEHRDLAAARAFFRSAKAVTGVTPDRVTTDGHDAYPKGNPDRALPPCAASDKSLSEQPT
jgi:putative transposase